jgi:DNA-binding CsgD family transcriptional regulator
MYSVIKSHKTDKDDLKKRLDAFCINNATWRYHQILAESEELEGLLNEILHTKSNEESAVLLTEFYMSLDTKLRDRNNIELTKLSPRERDVFDLIIKGLSNKESAKLLSLSPHTVSDHVKAIYKKLNINSRSEAVLKFALVY